ncbi:group III truncated hemoglobin [Fodinicurvata sediminis]|uniref:group III truncated hemoglobin n=1 Tax=Fodinicurvata sediminis TaxID=1121832 RepID=UPI0003B61DCD|nr:group III truncated hemoglobin [Fodinicurvata sediminis]
MTAAERREAVTNRIIEETGIDEAMIERLVQAFYGKVRQDPVLGPVFEAQVKDWDLHLQRMCAFWSSVALLTGRYHGRPMEKHLNLPVDHRHFDHWLALFRETANEVCPPAAAHHFVERAERIAESLELGIAGFHGHVLMKGERLQRPDSEVHLPETSRPEGVEVGE